MLVSQTNPVGVKTAAILVGPLLENFRRAFFPDPTDCPCVSEGAQQKLLARCVKTLYSRPSADEPT